MKEIFFKIKNYFTVNIYRKIFFYSMLIALAFAIVNAFVQEYVLYILIIISVIVSVIASLIDSMKARVVFLQKVKEMQLAHIEELLARQQSGEKVAMTSTFTEKERKYLNSKKRAYIGLIVFKAIIALLLFTLIFSL